MFSTSKSKGKRRKRKRNCCTQVEKGNESCSGFLNVVANILQFLFWIGVLTYLCFFYALNRSFWITDDKVNRIVNISILATLGASIIIGLLGGDLGILSGRKSHQKKHTLSIISAICSLSLSFISIILFIFSMVSLFFINLMGSLSHLIPQYLVISQIALLLASPIVSSIWILSLFRLLVKECFNCKRKQ